MACDVVSCEIAMLLSAFFVLSLVCCCACTEEHGYAILLAKSRQWEGSRFCATYNKNWTTDIPTDKPSNFVNIRTFYMYVT